MKAAERVRRGRRAIALAKRRGIDTGEWERHLAGLMAGREPEPDDAFEPWMLREWRRVSTPEWREILNDSIERGELRREEYARWMLREVLLDLDYDDSSSKPYAS